MRLKNFIKNKLLKQKTEIEQKLDLRKFLVPNKTGNLFDYETSYLTPNPYQFGVEVSDFLVDSTHRNTVKISLDLAAIVKAQKIAPNLGLQILQTRLFCVLTQPILCIFNKKSFRLNNNRNTAQYAKCNRNYCANNTDI